MRDREPVRGGPGGPAFTRGYGLAFGNNERKALSMALVDRSLRAGDLGEAVKGPAQDQEFVLAHGESVEAAGFVSHLKLPHYVDFQTEIGLLRDIRKGLAKCRTAGKMSVFIRSLNVPIQINAAGEMSLSY